MHCIFHASKIYLLFIYVGRTAFLIPPGGSPSLIPSSLNIFSSIPDYLLLIHLGGLLFLIHHEARFLIHLEFFFLIHHEPRFLIHPGIALSHPFWITLVSCIQDCPVSSIHPDDLFKIHPWGWELVGRPLMTVSWKLSGHMLSPYGPWPQSMKVSILQSSSLCPRVEIRL